MSDFQDENSFVQKGQSKAVKMGLEINLNNIIKTLYNNRLTPLVPLSQLHQLLSSDSCKFISGNRSKSLPSSSRAMDHSSSEEGWGLGTCERTKSTLYIQERIPEALKVRSQRGYPLSLFSYNGGKARDKFRHDPHSMFQIFNFIHHRQILERLSESPAQLTSWVVSLWVVSDQLGLSWTWR